MHVIVGITGGIAAYKATGIIRQLTEAGHNVKVIPTQNALRFIGATTLEALSHNNVDPDLYTDVSSVKHVQLGQQADLVIVAPASAAFLSRFASGQADDLLGNTLLVTKAPVLVAPAMHTEMWLNPATQQNVATLRSRGVEILEPATGRLTGSDSGPGRLPEADEIVAAALALTAKQDLLGKRILITAGGTLEPIDPVRFIGNRSSGKQGVALAKQAKRRGARVTLIGANISQPDGGVDEFISVATAIELERALIERIQTQDALIMAAAVSDYRVATESSTKLKKSEIGDSLSLELVANPDILASATKLVADLDLNTQVVGFAAETVESPANLTELALKKIKAKGCDLLIANNVTGGAVFGDERNTVIIVEQTGQIGESSGSKSDVANAILDVLALRLK
jgi:phosphopantothenoylcysteine decarboxylase / phosphopantothenate---cysteine ligase